MGQVVTYKQDVDEDLPFTHDFNPFCDLYDTTLSSTAAQNVDDGLTFTLDTPASNKVTGNVTASRGGMYFAEILATFASGRKEKITFKFDIKDKTDRRSLF